MHTGWLLKQLSKPGVKTTVSQYPWSHSGQKFSPCAISYLFISSEGVSNTM